MNLQKHKLLYKGKAKDVYSTENENFVIQHFKDDITAGNGLRHEIIENKGVVNCGICTYLMQVLAKNGVENHFLQQLNNREQLVKVVKIIPLEVIVRNIASGSFCKRFAIENGVKFEEPCVEFSYKDDSLGDPAISEGQIVAMQLANRKQIEYISQIALKVNAVLQKEFKKINLTLIDFKIEFGLDIDGNIILADEISPDSCRLWSLDGKSFDKDVFRKSTGSVMDGYNFIYNNLCISQQHNCCKA